MHNRRGPSPSTVHPESLRPPWRWGNVVLAAQSKPGLLPHGPDCHVRLIVGPTAPVGWRPRLETQALSVEQAEALMAKWNPKLHRVNTQF